MNITQTADLIRQLQQLNFFTVIDDVSMRNLSSSMLEMEVYTRI